MQAYSDLYVALSGQLHDDPVSLLRLSMVDRAANKAVAQVFNTAFLSRAKLTLRCFEYTSLMTEFNIPLCFPCYYSISDERKSYTYEITWGALKVSISSDRSHVYVNLWVGRRHIGCSRVTRDVGIPLDAPVTVWTSIARFAVRLFPGAYVVHH